MVDGLICVALEIAEKNAAIKRKMKQAILNDDLSTTVKCAAILVGMNEAETAPHLQVIPLITKRLSLVSPKASTI